MLCAYEGLELEIIPPFGTQPAEAVSSSRRIFPESGQRILVVDDDDSHRTLAKQALKRSNFNVQVAAGGLEALRVLESWHPALVLLDMVMPSPDGLEVLRTLRARPQTAKLPVIMLTSNNAEATTQAGFVAGATDFITKPFVIPQLIARVRACLARAEK